MRSSQIKPISYLKANAAEVLERLRSSIGADGVALLPAAKQRAAAFEEAGLSQA